MNTAAAKRFLLDRAREGSTYRGIVLILTAVGVALSPAQKEAIISFGLFLSGLIGALTSDTKPTEGENRHE